MNRLGHGLRSPTRPADGSPSERRTIAPVPAMYISRLQLKNWRNFRKAEVALQRRQFLVGPNASGKSNLLDVFRFLREVAKQRGGGLQEAIQRRGGLARIRCLGARKDPGVVIEVALRDSENSEPRWRYRVGLTQEPRGYRQPFLDHERVWDRGHQILDRPDEDDRQDRERLTQTYLEQVNNNKEFREIRHFFESIAHAHLVPQLVRYSDSIQGRIVEDDPFGQGFLERVAKTPGRTQRSRLEVINRILSVTVPKLKDIRFERDPDSGRPHISALHSHWRPNAGRQREDQFSDGTLRLIALVWSLLDGDAPLLLEEPELSLHAGIVKQLASLLYRAQKRRDRQVFVSTHSSELLGDAGIGGEEVLLLRPTPEGTEITPSSALRDVRPLLEAGIPVGEVVISPHRTRSAEPASALLTLIPLILIVEGRPSEQVARKMLDQPKEFRRRRGSAADDRRG